jgi:hypothetical protein
LNKTKLKVLEMIFVSTEVTIPEMAKKAGFTERAIEKISKSSKRLNF